MKTDLSESVIELWEGRAYLTLLMIEPLEKIENVFRIKYYLGDG